MYTTYLSLFLLGFTSIFPLINPIGTAIIVDPFLKGLKGPDRNAAVLKIITNGFFLGLGSLIAGSWVLKFMGISVVVTQAAGGLIIARMGLTLLDSSPSSAPEDETPKLNNSISNSLFYPITFPLTLGPGGISVLITLSAHAHVQSIQDSWIRLGVLSLSLLTVFGITFICYAYSDRVINRIGNSGSLVIKRLSAFLVFAIGVQMATLGFKGIFPHLLN